MVARVSHLLVGLGLLGWGARLYARDPHLIGRRVLQRTYGVAFDHYVDQLPAPKRNLAADLEEGLVRSFSAESGKMELWRPAVKVCATVGNEVDTTEWIAVTTMDPGRVGDSKITFDVVVFNEQVPDSKGRNAVLMMGELPEDNRQEFTYERDIPPQLLAGNSTKLSVELRFRADGVELRLGFSNDDHEVDGTTQSVKHINLLGGT